MEPFCKLVKHNATFQWNATLDQLFEQSKELLISKVKEGINTSDVNRKTCLQTNWSKSGIGYLLLQKYCGCPNENAPVCCTNGFKLVFAGSRFTTSTENQYSPTDGEALAVAWSLENARMFVLGCKGLTVATDHKSLLEIFNNCGISSIPNPCIHSLEEKTLRCAFKTIYCPGKWQRPAQAVSQNPTSFLLDPTLPIHQDPSDKDIPYAESINDNLSQQIIPTLLNLINERPDHTPSVYNIKTDMTLNNLEQVCPSDTTYQLLIKRIECGFPSTYQELDAKIRYFWNV